MKNKIQRKIYKINSKRFRLNNWNLTLTKDNTMPEEIVKLADNQIFEFIRQINGIKLEDEQFEITEVKRLIRKKINVSDNVLKLNQLIFIKSVIFIEIDRVSDYHNLNKYVILNGKNFKRLFATTGGVKNSTIIYVDSEIHDELQRRINNERNFEIPFSAGKLEAYKSLTFTNSLKVSNPRSIVVVNDLITKFVEDEVIELDDSTSRYPTMEIKRNCEMEVNVSDGFGVISLEYANIISEDLELDYVPSGFLMRNSFTKGMFFPMDIQKYAREIAKSDTITDIYGDTHKINLVDMIMPESVFKLWSSYKNIKDYLDKCDKNGYSFRVAKVTPKVLDNRRNLNYQFIQTLELSDEDIKNLSSYTVNQIKDIINNDYIKSILFTKGNNLTDKSIYSGMADYTKALMISKEVINDPFVKTKIYNMIKKKINDAKIGVLSVEGNFQTISGEPFQFLEHSFGVENPRGFLLGNEIYSKYWVDKGIDKVALFRAPMSSHNNIRKVCVKNTPEIEDWYGHLDTIMIISSYDTITHALNGADKDGDSFFSTNNDVILNNVRKLPTVICKQKQADKKVCTFDDFVTANINGFGDEIGSITNKITSMISKQANFDNKSKEYEELKYRILCGQLYQQNAIDKIKSIQAKPMPLEWYSFKDNILEKNEEGEITLLDEFNVSILADKKPYFFIYNYPSLKKEYSTYVKNANTKCITLFGMTIDELVLHEPKNKEMEDFLNKFSFSMPVDNSNGVMNRLCRYIEHELNDVKFQSTESFNIETLKTNSQYSTRNYNKVKSIYENYKLETSKYSARHREGRIRDDEYSADRDSFKLKYISLLSELKIEDEELANIVIDLCYTSNNSKQFAWDVAGEVILKNLLKNNSNKVTFPMLDKFGDVEFNGNTFKVLEVEVGDEFAHNN